MQTAELIRLGEVYFQVTFPIKKDDFKRIYRKAAMRYHPDKGGNAEQFKTLSVIYEEINNLNNTIFFINEHFNTRKNEQKQNPNDYVMCSNCSGTGVYQSSFKGKILSRHGCEFCKGAGQQSVDDIIEQMKDNMLHGIFGRKEANK